MTATDPRRDQILQFLRTLPGVAATSSAADAFEFDSLALLQVVEFIESTFGVRLADENVEPDDLRSVDGILAVIARVSEPAGER